MARTADINRKTQETEVALTLALDGEGRVEVDTGIGFFNHMLTHIGHHSLFDMVVRAQGDVHVDFHHTVEDVGIVLGKAMMQAVTSL